MPSLSGSGPEPGAAQPRRYFIAIGAAQYEHLPVDDQLSSASLDVERMTRLFCEKLGYRHILPDLVNSPTSDQVRGSLSDWFTAQARRADDVIVIYYSGHGLVWGGRHYMLTRDSQPHNPVGTAFATGELAHMLSSDMPPQNLLILIDCCYAGWGGHDFGRNVAVVAESGWSAAPSASGWWVVAASRSRELAQESWFARAFEVAVGRPRTGPRQRYVSLDQLVDFINDHFTEHNVPQQARYTAAEGGRGAVFIPNLTYDHAAAGGEALEWLRVLHQENFARHWLPRARGLSTFDEPGWYFCGRTRVLQRLVDWLSGPDTDYRARAVTGDPGSGKSAVLGRLVTLADPKARELAVRHEVEPSTVPPVGSIDVAIYARNHATADVLAALADGLKIQAITVPELLEAVGTKPRHRVVVIDGVDEAADPRDLVTGLIRPLLEHAPRASLRLLLGIRRPLVDALGPHTVVLDLDDPSYFKQDDVADYVAKILLRTEARPPSPGERPQQPPGRGRTALTSPYTGRPELARMVARAIAERAGRNFLVARLVARDHLRDQPIPEPHAFAWRQRLPETVREAFEHYLEQFGDNRQKARDLLTPLAWAEGAGLPWEHLWAPIARSLAEQGTYTDDDVSWLLTAAAAYLVEGREVYPRDSGTEGRSVYRLYHQALADHLRDESKTADVQSRIVDALVASVPREPAGAIDWFGAHPYILSYLPVHAAAAGRLDEFMSDPRFLLSVDADRLLEILPRLTKPSAIAAHMVYQQCVHQLRAGPTGLASAYLMMMARQSGIHALADEVARLASAAPWSMPWTTPWAHWHRSRPYRLARRQVNPPPVVALSFFGSPQAIVSADEAGTVQLWDVQLATEVGQGIRTQWRGVTALAVVTLADGPAVITGGAEGTLHLWNPLTGEELGDAVHAHNGNVLAMAVEAYDHSPVLVSGGEDGTVRVWKLPDCRPIGSPLTPRQPVSRRPRPSAVTALATSVLGGDLVAVAGMADGSLHFWDVGLGRQLGEVSEAHIPRVRALATATVGNQTLLLSGGDDGVVRIWDLRQRRPVGEPLAGHRRGVHAVAACLVQGRLLIVSGGWDGAIKVWDERDRRPVGNPLAAHRGQVRTAVVGEHEKVPVIVSGGQDGTIRFCEWTREDVVSDRMPGSDRRMRALTAAYRGDRPVVVAGGAGGTLRMYDWADGTQVIAPMIGHSLAVTSVATFLVDGRRTIVSASWDESVRFWDMSSGGFINACYSAHSSGVRCLATAQLRTRPVVVSGGADGKLRAWDPGAAVPLGAGFVVHRGEVTAVAVTRIGREPFVVSAGSDQCVWMTRLTDRMILGELRGHNSVVCALEVDSEAGGMVVGGTEDGVVLMWDPKRPHSAARLVHRHQDRVSALTTCTYDGQTVVASGSSDCTVLVRMLASGQTQTVEVGLPVRALRLMPGGVGLVIGCDSGLLALRFRSFGEQPGSMGGGAGGG